MKFNHADKIKVKVLEEMVKKGIPPNAKSITYAIEQTARAVLEDVEKLYHVRHDKYWRKLNKDWGLNE